MNNVRFIWVTTRSCTIRINIALLGNQGFSMELRQFFL